MIQQFDIEAFDAICDRHHIPARFRPSFYQFAENGTICDPALRDQLNNNFNFKAASEEFVEFLASDYSALFSTTPHYESLDEGDFPPEPAMSNATPVLDFMGREIKVGDTVVYPVRQGSSMWMQRIRVTQVIGGTAPKLGGFNNEGRKITIHKISNATVVEPLPVPKV